MQEPPNRLTPANMLTAFRLVAAPLMLLLAIYGQHTLFLWLLLASFLTDAADGLVARLTGAVTEFGSRLDSYADAIAYAAIGVSLLLLWPEIVKAERAAFLILLVSLVLPAAAGFLKYGQLTSYHTWLVKIAVVTVAVGLLLMLTGGTAWLFRVAVLIAALSALEQVAMTLLLREPRFDVAGILTAFRSRRLS